MEPQPQVETADPKRWADTVWETYGGLQVVPDRDEEFSASLGRRDFDRLKALSMRTTPSTFQRTAPMVDRHPADELMISMVVEGEGLVVQDGRNCALRPGEFTIMESARPFTMVLSRPSRVIDFAWPRELVALSERESAELTARVFGASSPLGRWLSPMLRDLYQIDGELSQAGAIRLANEIAALLVTTALEVELPAGADARSRRQFDDMVRFIERNLDDPGLSADSVAGAFFVSTRTVHRLFARYDKTIAAVIRDLRLEACRQMILSPARRARPIGFIASQFGFSSPQVFSRAFAAKYGVSPGTYRATQG